MLPAPHRLQASRAFERLFQSGRKLYACAYFVVLYRTVEPLNVQPAVLQPTRKLQHQAKARRDETPGLRVGFVISKKVHKRAVLRNRLKRRLRALVRQHWLQGSALVSSSVFQEGQHSLTAGRVGQHLVLVCRPASVQASFTELEEALLQVKLPPLESVTPTGSVK